MDNFYKSRIADGTYQASKEALQKEFPFLDETFWSRFEAAKAQRDNSKAELPQALDRALAIPDIQARLASPIDIAELRTQIMKSLTRRLNGAIANEDVLRQKITVAITSVFVDYLTKLTVSDDDPAWEHKVAQIEQLYSPIADQMAAMMVEHMPSARAAMPIVDEVIIRHFSDDTLRTETARVDRAYDDAFSSVNPTFESWGQLINKYFINVPYSADINRYQQFEEFIDQLCRTRLSSIFTGPEIETLSGLLAVKFKFHSIDRRLQFLSGLIESLNGAADKASVIVAVASNSGVPVVKVVQMLVQKNAFAALESDADEGRKLNEKVGEVRSNNDPIQKAAIFQILEKMGLLSSVAKIGRRLGSASIKQVHHVVLAAAVRVKGKTLLEAALKVKRPSANKHLEEDFRVLEKMVAYFNGRHPKLAISPRLISRARKAIDDEKDFPLEMAAGDTMRNNLDKRGSSFNVPAVLPVGNGGHR